jgi:hypothetical protein
MSVHGHINMYTSCVCSNRFTNTKQIDFLDKNKSIASDNNNSGICVPAQSRISSSSFDPKAKQMLVLDPLPCTVLDFQKHKKEIAPL